MTTLQLKNKLIDRIKEIEDVEFLNEIKAVLDSKSNQKIIALTSDQKNEIRESKKELRKGHFISQSNLDKEVEKWAEEK